MIVEQAFPHVHQAVWSAVGAIPGCAIDTIEFVGRSNLNATVLTMAVKIDGWSPSLHKVAINWRMSIGMGLTGRHEDSEASARSIVARMRDILDIQSARARAGLALGSGAPLRADGGAPSRCDHLHADASVLAVMIDRGQTRGDTPGNTIKGLIALPLADLHTSSTGYEGRDMLNGDKLAVREADGIRFVDLTWNVTEDRRVNIDSAQGTVRNPSDGGAPVVIIGSSTVMISGAVLPETAIAAATGRKVGEIADIHPSVNGRRIVSAQCGGEWIWLETNPVTVPLGELLNRGAHEALEILNDAIAAQG